MPACLELSWKALSCFAPLVDVLEILPVGKLAPLPRVPVWVLGVAHHRGHLFVVNDLGYWLTGKISSPQNNLRWLWVKDEHNSVAFLIPEPKGMGECSSDNAWVWDGSQPVPDQTKQVIIDFKGLLRNPSFTQVGSP